MTWGVINFSESLLNATSGCSLHSKIEIDSSHLHKTIRKTVKAQQNESNISSNIVGLCWIKCWMRIFFVCVSHPAFHQTFQHSLRKSVSIRSYSGPHFPAFRLNTDQNNSEYGHFLRSDFLEQLHSQDHNDRKASHVCWIYFIIWSSSSDEEDLKTRAKTRS